MRNLLLLLTVLLAACEEVSVESPAIGSMTRHTIQHGALEREYFVFLPSRYESGAELPFVFFLHGYGGSATGTEVAVSNDDVHGPEDVPRHCSRNA